MSLNKYENGQLKSIAGSIQIDTTLSETSTNAVQNKVITKAIKALKPGGGGGSDEAVDINYDNSISGLSASNVQDAITEVYGQTKNKLPGYCYTQDKPLVSFDALTSEGIYIVENSPANAPTSNAYFIVEVIGNVGSDCLQKAYPFNVNQNGISVIDYYYTRKFFRGVWTDWEIVKQSAVDTTYSNSSSGLSATDVQAAIDELSTKIPSGDGTADSISYDNSTSKLTSTNIQGAIDEINSKIGGNSGASVYKVAITYTDSPLAVTFNKTYAEVAKAITDGQIVMGESTDGKQWYVLLNHSSYIIFGYTDHGLAKYAYLKSDNSTYLYQDQIYYKTDIDRIRPKIYDGDTNPYFVGIYTSTSDIPDTQQLYSGELFIVYEA